MAQIKKDTSIRKAILQAAITGQLISDTGGESLPLAPASRLSFATPSAGDTPATPPETGKQLLDRIIEERNKKLLAEWEEALKTNPKAKKPAPVVASKIDEDEIPFEIPENWCWCRLNDVIDVRDGTHDTPSYILNGIPLITGKDFYNGYFDLSKTQYISQKDFEIISSRSRVEIDDILFSMIGGNIGSLIHITKENYFEMAIKNVALFKQYDYKNSIAEYLEIFLRSQTSNFKEIAKGGAQTFVSLTVLRDYPFPLPPLAVQNAIVAKLEQVLPLVDAYENAVLQKEELKSALPDKVKKAILQEAITGKLTESWRKSAAITESGQQLLDRIISERNAKALADWEEAVKTNPKAKKPMPVAASEIEEDEIPFEIPESWCWCRLGEICTKLVDGDHNPPAGLSIKTDYIMASSQNINDDTLVDLDKVRYLSKEVFNVENERTNATKGDIFFTSVGTLGRSCVFDGSKNICFQRSVSVLNTEIYNKYLKYCLDAPFIQFFIIDNATGTAQKGFYLNQLANLVIPLPPLEEQNEIVKKVEELLSLCK